MGPIESAKVTNIDALVPIAHNQYQGRQCWKSYVGEIPQEKNCPREQTVKLFLGKEQV